VNSRDALFVIVNPTSGGGAGMRMPEHVRTAFVGRAHDVHLTEGPGHAEELAFAAANDGASRIVAVGGDGTVHEVANGLLRALEQDNALSAALGIVPVGTGNDFVKMLPGTNRRRDALETVLDGTVRRVDVGFARWDGGTEYFVNAAGMGIDVEVVRLLGSHRGTRGALDYVVALLRALRRYRPIPLSIRAETHESSRRIMIAAVGNGRCVGGTFRICPAAEVDDGLFDVCAVSALPIGASLLTAARILRGTHVGARGVESFRARTVELTVPEGTDLFFQLDGELREPVGAKTLTIEIRPATLPVLVRELPVATRSRA